ncbi:putative oxidoreductase, nitronate monooxygenase family [Olavius algarvensis associated proteobacterium Delta 3]|nr:putative oxidoreductase, nitronate monooxygenase family [Olavius algarvensis associated proteobacterium Delta 3]
MWNDKRAIDLLEIEHPVIQAPMAGPTNPQLVAAVCEAGGLGGLGAAGKSPDDLKVAIREIKSLTDRPFNVNLFNRSTEGYDSEARTGPRLNELLQSYHFEMGLGLVPDPVILYGPADKQLEVLIDERVPVVSFHFGVDAPTVATLKEAGTKVLCSATTVSEAILLEELGVDAIIAQGAEAGGHRGTFQGNYRLALVGTVALVPRVVDAVSKPVIAAGGIMDPRGIVACLALGASAVQMGTAFLGCPEASVAPVWRDALEAAEAESTVVTKVFSGKPARGLYNRFIEELEAIDEPLLPYPAQFAVSRELRKEAARRGEESFVAMWAGQGVGLFRRQPAAELVKQLVADSQQLIKRLARG